MCSFCFTLLGNISINWNSWKYTKQRIFSLILVLVFCLTLRIKQPTGSCWKTSSHNFLLSWKRRRTDQQSFKLVLRSSLPPHYQGYTGRVYFEYLLYLKICLRINISFLLNVDKKLKRKRNLITDWNCSHRIREFFYHFKNVFNFESMLKMWFKVTSNMLWKY